ncbi:MAG: (2Fe-2S)-binding protein [Sediminicola sp.]
MAEIYLHLTVNGIDHSLEVDAETPLLYVLRNHLRLNGPKFGCGLQQCGACMVLMDGESVPSCRLPVKVAARSEIITLEGLVGAEGQLHKVQQAFVDEQAAQCGYCINGMIMASAALLQKNPSPSQGEIREKLSINICRCGIHDRIIKAVIKASKLK